jgi:acetyl esterase/lipase
MKCRLFAATFCAALALSAFAQLPVPGTVVPLWPHGTPEPAQTTASQANVATEKETLAAGYAMVRLSNVTQPAITLYPAPGAGNHAAALVFPGGGYKRLAMEIEGTQTCAWLNSIQVSCLIVTYRVPEDGVYPANPADLEDAQQAMRLARAHAADWHLDAEKIGIVGFSAGGNLGALLSTHADDEHVLSTPAKADVPTAHGKPLDARANFAVLVYPAYLAVAPDQRELQATYAPNKLTPPTFLIAAGDDKLYGRNAPVYYRALLDAGVPADLHMFATGGHGFGTYPPVTKPENNWTALATAWLRNLKVAP